MPQKSIPQAQFNENHPYQTKKEKVMNTTTGSPHGTNSKYAVIAGILFIIGTAAGTVSAITGSKVWNAPDYLPSISAHENLIILGIFLQFIMAISCAGISLALYPILKKFSTGLAIGAVGFRLIENMLQVLKGVSMVSLLALSQEFIRAGSPNHSYFQGAGEIITASSDWMIHGAGLICFSIGAAMYYMVFYQHRLLPRWLSVWGLVGITLVIISGVLVMLQVIPGFGTVQVVLNLPIFPQEMVLAVWLIVKGLNPSEVASESAKTATTKLLSAA
jgi:hypothetical protein